MQVCCLDCTDFTADEIGFGQGIGECKSYETGLLKQPSATQIKQARMARGNAPDYGVFWGGTGKRSCKKFQAKKSPASKKIDRALKFN